MRTLWRKWWYLMYDPDLVSLTRSLYLKKKKKLPLRTDALVDIRTLKRSRWFRGCFGRALWGASSQLQTFVSSLQGLGNLGLQNFHQRTLSAASSSTAKITCFAAAFIVPTLGIPPILLGAVAASTGTVQEQKCHSSCYDLHSQKLNPNVEGQN